MTSLVACFVIVAACAEGLVEAHAPNVGNAAAMRQVAADAVLGELDRMDFVHSEFARTLEDLSHEFRAQHVADIKRFRESVVPEPDPGQPTWDVYIDRWLGLHTEVAIERSTGAIKAVLVEIDRARGGRGGANRQDDGDRRARLHAELEQTPSKCDRTIAKSA